MISISTRRLTPALTVMVLFAAACSAGGAADPARAAADSAPTPEELAGATYAGILEEPVTLVNGSWEGKPFVDGGASRPAVGLVERFALEGDLDGDGHPETVALLWESSGGSGTRSYLAAMGRADGAVANLGTALIGDRVQVKSGTIAGGRITLELVEAGPGDAACCPSQRTKSEWALTGAGLERVATEIEGPLSLGDLAGPEWRLRELGWGQPVPDDVVITIAFQDGRVAGTGGCNRYFASVSSEGPGILAFGATGTTMMACPDPAMDLEGRYLATLADAASYSFQAGRLVIGCETDEGHVTLVFSEGDGQS